MTELNSSPCKRPAAIACVNCVIAELTSLTFAPDNLNCIFNCSTNAIASSFDEKLSFANIFNLATLSSMSVYEPLDRSEAWYTLSIMLAVDCEPSLIKSIRALMDANLSLTAVAFAPKSSTSWPTKATPATMPAIGNALNALETIDPIRFPSTFSALLPTSAMACCAPSLLPLIITLIDSNTVSHLLPMSIHQ